VHDRLAALPGSRLLAVRNGGTIPDRGSFGAYLSDRKTRLGELDEEFVYETQPGDVFTLGANTWRVLEVTEERVIVSPAPGYLPRMPFWRGEFARRDYHLGKAVRRVPARDRPAATAEEESASVDWLMKEYCLDRNSARNAVEYVRHQVEVLGAISSDRTVIAELFADPVGDLRLVIHSCFGSRVNSLWALALTGAFREALAASPRCSQRRRHPVRFLETDREPPLNLVREMGRTKREERVLAELPGSALFGAQFRMNAPAPCCCRRQGRPEEDPLLAQRLRAKDLLNAVKGFKDFPHCWPRPYRDCLRDVLDLAHAEEYCAASSPERPRGDHRPKRSCPARWRPACCTISSPPVHVRVGHHQQMQALLLGRDLLGQLLDEASPARAAAA